MSEEEKHKEHCPDHSRCDKATELYRAAIQFASEGFKNYVAYSKVKLNADPLDALMVWYEMSQQTMERMYQGLTAFKLSGFDPVKMREMLGITPEQLEESSKRFDEMEQLWRMGEGIDPNKEKGD